MPEPMLSFDRAADYYDQTRTIPDDVAEHIGAFIADKAGFTAEDHLLEAGIGTGRIAVPLAPHVGRITGVDISPKMMHRIPPKQPAKPLSLSIADVHFLPFAAHCFDAAYISHVLHLVSDPLRVLHDLHRVVKPGGLFLHLRNRYQNEGALQRVYDAWDAATKREHSRNSTRWQRIDKALRESPWTFVAEEVFTFAYTARISDLLERLEKRQWSSTWIMDEATWRAGLAAVYAAIDEHLDGNRQASRESSRDFIVEMYTRQ